MIIAGSSNLWTYGEKNYEEELIDKAKQLNIKFLGLTSPKIVKQLHETCDIFVLPSLVHEAHPLVILDAMAAGTVA